MTHFLPTVKTNSHQDDSTKDKYKKEGTTTTKKQFNLKSYFETYHFITLMQESSDNNYYEREECATAYSDLEILEKSQSSPSKTDKKSISMKKQFTRSTFNEQNKYEENISIGLHLKNDISITKTNLDNYLQDDSSLEQSNENEPIYNEGGNMPDYFKSYFQTLYYLQLLHESEKDAIQESFFILDRKRRKATHIAEQHDVMHDTMSNVDDENKYYLDMDNSNHEIFTKNSFGTITTSRNDTLKYQIERNTSTNTQAPFTSYRTKYEFAWNLRNLQFPFEILILCFMIALFRACTPNFQLLQPVVLFLLQKWELNIGFCLFFGAISFLGFLIPIIFLLLMFYFR